MDLRSLSLIVVPLLSILGLCQGQGGLFPPGPVYGIVGDKVLFTSTITPSSTPLLSVSWTFNGNTSVITSSTAVNNTGPAYRDRVSVNIYTGALELRDLTLDDSGTYGLIAVPVEGIPQQDQTALDVFERISGVSLTGPRETLVENKTSANLTCEGTGSNITTEWMKDGQPLSPSDRIIFSADLRSVSISPVRRSDSGEYQCRLSNPVSSDTATYTMTVKDGGSLSGGGGGLSGGAIAGIIIGVIVVIGGVAGLVFYVTKAKKRSKANAASGTDKQSNNASHQQDKGDTDVNYADVRVFRKANGEQVQLGNVGGANTVYSDVRGNTAANQRPPQVDHETQYSQIARPGVQTSPATYAQVKK